ncbi:MAG: hypothetical protein FJ083_16615 [Cyanobacteria bacterium K_Offshore_surface_m2_239]|nr:hypothetical protein [Cyanobacteria bacterium K_Offshore_surface_m2_239]
MPVALDGGSIVLGSVTIPADVTIGNGPSEKVPVWDGGGTLSIDDGGGSITVDGPVTNEQLRASPLEVTGGLTVQQLRASPLEVTGGLTVQQLRASPLEVTGGITNEQLRASPLATSTVATPRVPTTTSVAGTTSTVTILNANAGRKGLMINNQSTSKLLLSFNTPATPANSFLQMDPGAFLLLDQALFFTSAVYGTWTNATGAAQVTEFA